MEISGEMWREGDKFFLRESVGGLESEDVFLPGVTRSEGHRLMRKLREVAWARNQADRGEQETEFDLIRRLRVDQGSSIRWQFSLLGLDG